MVITFEQICLFDSNVCLLQVISSVPHIVFFVIKVSTRASFSLFLDNLRSLTEFVRTLREFR